MVEKKVVIPAAFTQQGRDKNAEKLKAKYEKAGWTIKEHISGGMTKPSYLIVQKEPVGKKEKMPSSFGWPQAITMVLAILAVSMCTLTNSQPEFDLSKAKSYAIIEKEDFSFPGRNRLGWVITSPARTFEERAQTAIKAAITLQKELKADIASVRIEPDPELSGLGYPLAIANYSPDNGGYSGDQGWTWRVEASRNQISPQQIAIAKMWKNNRESFLKPDGSLDEPNLRMEISKNLGLPFEQVHLPWAMLEKYEIQK
ncbi:DUF4875 domain-containing protein [Desulfuromonas acetoxidans]|uniref:DUF4875 domain-containing protein n=1 Tax=Desulfuromonas acetoxidans TaxID=891 RepID=UPI0029313182|nr:DUF4875 domain-containing protein [Desulfuromonas acetoxidans]